MMVTIGFVLLTYTKPAQIQRLVNRLNVMFDDPPIVCHHDFAKCTLPIKEFPTNVSFVQPQSPSGWGIFATVEAALRAIKQMYDAPASPDWFVLLSGSDYPIKPAATIRGQLENSPYDAYILRTLIQFNNWKDDWWQRLCYERYCTKTWYYPSLTRRLRPTRRVLVLKHPLLTRPFLPFSDHFRCYAGQFWFTANRRAAEYILRFYATRPRLAAHYRTSHVQIPEESYFNCVLGNAPGLKLENNDYRYIDWSRGGSHPKTLGIEDLPKLLSSTDHFARKFDIHHDARILDELDAAT
jgi:Core-2/I-Branching enzyme